MQSSERGLRTERAVSAGGVVYRRGAQGTSSCCSAAATAIVSGRCRRARRSPVRACRRRHSREVREETGLGVEIERTLGSIAYTFERPAQGVRFDKTVHHYLLQPDGTGSIETHDGEYDCVGWFAADDALRIVTHRNEARVIRRAIDAIERRRCES